MSIKNIAIIKAGVVIDISAVEELDEQVTVVLNSHFENPDELIEVPENMVPFVTIGTPYSNGNFTPINSPGDPSAWTWSAEENMWLISVPKPELSDPDNILIWDNETSTWNETTL